MKKKLGIIIVIALFFITIGFTKYTKNSVFKTNSSVVKNETLNGNENNYDSNSYDEEPGGKGSEIVCNPSLNGYIEKCKNKSKAIKESESISSSNEVLKDNSIKSYKTGTTAEVDIIYFNPVSGEKCDVTQSDSTPNTKTGCMKWYVIENSDETKNTVTIMLDHNTTEHVAYNSAGDKNTMGEAKIELDNLVNVSKWKFIPRLITVDEVAKIVGADKEPTNFSSLTAGPWSGFYFETKKNEVPSPYTGIYSWLYDYTKGCKRDKCEFEDPETFGYLTSSPVASEYYNNIIWFVVCTGNINPTSVTDSASAGIRPVITIQKSLLK